MARVKKTTATFEIRIEVPKGDDIHQIHLYIREAILKYNDKNLPEDSLVVVLKKKEIVYA